MIRDYCLDASQLANDYYETQRQLWAQYAGIDMPDYDHGTLVEPDRVLWQQQHGFSDTDFNGLTYQQVKEGRSRAGMTIDDLWPSLTDVDDAQQFIADMIATAGRLTMQRNIRLDPSAPRWGRFCHGDRPCSFCVMLASRGYAYLSRETASLGGGFHNGRCRCTVEPDWGDDTHPTAAQREWLAMYEAARQKADGTDPEKIGVAMNHLYPDRVSGGVYELTGEWPDDVIRPSARVWDHVFSGHGPGTRVPNKTHFPDEWPEDKVKWAVKETIVSPDLAVTAADGNREQRYKIIEDTIIRVWLQKRRSTKGRWMVNTSHPMADEAKEQLWQRIRNAKPPTDG